MPWGPEKCAGFALAALVADDRALDRVAPALTPAQRDELAQQLPTETRDQVASRIARFVAQLKPDLRHEATRFPARMRALLAKAAPPALRAPLLSGAEPTRQGFASDEELIAAVLRIARYWSRKAQTP